MADLVQSPSADAAGRPTTGYAVPSIPRYSGEREIERATKGLVALLAVRCATRPLLLVVEDCHLAGDNGIAVLRALAQAISAYPVLLLTTEHRSGERLRTSLTATPMDTPITVSELLPLSPSEMAELSRALLPDEGERAAFIAERSNGNPLFLINMAETATDQAMDMPSTIIAMVQARLDKVPPQSQQAALRAALVGQQVRKSELVAMFPELRDGIELPLGLGHWSDETFHFSHQLIQEAAYHLIPEEVARGWHLAAARHLKGREPVRFAEHALRSGDASLAAQACRDAANALLPQFRNEMASHYIEAGLAAGGLVDDHAELLFCRASMKREEGQYEAALIDYEAAEVAATSKRTIVQCMLRRCRILKLRDQREPARAVLEAAV
ncbi:MAG: hypothetical protein AAFY59_18640, partial [Pseudomonadota bacterium]